MSRELIENGVIIDETEGILEGLNEVSKTKISDLSVVYKFIKEDSSLIEKFKQCEDQPYAADARSKSGELKVTKESFRSALNSVCGYLGMAIA